MPGEECSPRDFLLSNVSGQTEDWHKFGMEWKEHIAWISPMLATLAAFLVFYYGPALARNRTARLLVLVVHRRVPGRGDRGPLRRPNHEDGADHVRKGR